MQDGAVAADLAALGHVVERYRLINHDAAREAWERGGKENGRGGAIAETWAPDANEKGKALQLQFTVDDPDLVHHTLVSNQDLSARAARVAGKRLCRKRAQVRHREGRCGPNG